MVAISYESLLSTWNVTRVTETLNFYFNLNLNSHMWLADPVSDSISLDSFTNLVALPFPSWKNIKI